MAVSVYKIEDVVVIKPTDDIRVRTLVDFRKCLEEIIAGGADRIAINLSQVRYIDSSGIGLLSNFAKRLAALGRMVYLFSPARELADILEMTNINEIIPIYSNEAEFRLKIVDM